jgi:phage-related minor tail protein
MNFGAEVGNALGNAFQGAEDALVSFVMTGKADFKGMIDSMIADLVRLAIRATIMRALSSATALAFAKDGAVVTPTGAGNNVTFSKAGNVVERTGAMNGLRMFANGGLIDSPIMFPMKNGAGVAGEAGREAILPTMRDTGTASVRGVTSTGNVEVPLTRTGGILAVDLRDLTPFADGGMTQGSESLPRYAQRGSDSGGGDTYYSIHNVITYQAGKGESGGSEQGGDMREFSKVLTKASEEAFAGMVREHQRNGGLLNQKRKY